MFDTIEGLAQRIVSRLREQNTKRELKSFSKARDNQYMPHPWRSSSKMPVSGAREWVANEAPEYKVKVDDKGRYILTRGVSQLGGTFKNLSDAQQYANQHATGWGSGNTRGLTWAIKGWEY